MPDRAMQHQREGWNNFIMNARPLTLTIMKLSVTASKFSSLFLSELQEIFWVEAQMSLVLPGMQQAVGSRDFVRILERGRLYSLNHTGSLLYIAESVNEQLQGVVCTPVSNMVETITRILTSFGGSEMVRDMSMMLAAQKIVQYQIVCYENLITLLQILAKGEFETILDSIIVDKQEMSLLLRELCERYLYKEADRSIY
jgi:ferritin-like metal-binding protein YciE